MKFERVLRRWAKATRRAEGNPGLLLSRVPFASEICVRRMDKISRVWALLQAFPDTEVNDAMRTFRAADADKGCSSCWLASGVMEHQACEVKIDRWFKAHEALVESGEK